MRRLGKFVASAAVALTVTLVPVSARAQGNAGPDNSAVAVNTHDGMDVFRLAFSIDRVMRDAPTPGNAAVAYSSCSDCRTTAIAIQVVFLESGQQDVSPNNLAIATNQNCTSCTSVALAYQIVLFTDGPVVISPEGERKISDILKEIRDLESQNLSPDELEARVDPLVAQLATVLQEETRSASPPGVVKQKSVSQTPSPSFVPPTEQPSGSSGPSVTPTPSETPTATPTGTS
jgi:hypothetical protein